MGKKKQVTWRAGKKNPNKLAKVFYQWQGEKKTGNLESWEGVGS